MMLQPAFAKPKASRRSPSSASVAGPALTRVISGRTLLVASSGGHVRELFELFPRLPLTGTVEWVTFDTPQTRSLLDGETVHYVGFIAPRDARSIARNVPSTRRILHDGAYECVVSTGSGIALDFVPVARAMGIECHYIESATRQSGPSLTGRVLGVVPGVRFYSQTPAWTDRRWHYAGSVFDGFETVAHEPRPLRRVVVTLGTLDFGFRRLVERLIQILPADVDVLWQTGGTDVSDLPIEGHRDVPDPVFVAAMREADAVISHGGVGSSLSVLEAARCPLLAPRLAAHGEHVDDHQTPIAADLARRGLAVCRDAGEITLDDVIQAGRLRARRCGALPPYPLQD